MKSIITKIIVLCMLLGTALFAISEAMPEDIDVVKEAEGAWNNTGGYVYFDNTNSSWNYTYIYFAMGHDSYTSLYEMTKVSNTSLYYYKSPNWDGVSYYAFIGSNASWTGGSWGYNNLKKANMYTGKYTTQHIMKSGAFNVFTPSSSSKGCSLSISWMGENDSYSVMNKTQTFKMDPVSSESSTTPGNITIDNGVKFSASNNTTSSNPSSNTITAAYGSTVKVTATENDGYTFIGWYNGTTVVSKSLEYSYTCTGNNTLTAKFSANTYIVTLNGNGATTEGTDSVTATFDSEMPSIILPQKTGYTFDGYVDNETGKKYYNADGTSANPWDIPNSETTLTAQWTANTYAVTLNENGATTAGTTSVTATYDLDMPTKDSNENNLVPPSKIGYTFQGYYDAQSDGNKYYNADMTSALYWNKASEETLYAHWSINQYTITLNYNDGRAAETITQDYNTDLSLPSPETSNPDLKGYKFGGWYKDNNTFKVKFDETKIPAQNIQLYAKWIQPAVITLDYNGVEINGISNKNITQAIGEELELEVLNPVAGKLFLGWSLASDGSSGIISQYTPSQDTKLYAQWHTVSSMINGELIIDYYYNETNVINIISVGIKIMATVEDVKDDYGLIHDLTVDGYKYEINVSNYTSSNDETTIINPIVILNASLTEEYHATLSIKNGNSYVYIDSGRSFTVSDLVNNYLSTNNDTTSETYKVVQYLYNILQSSE